MEHPKNQVKSLLHYLFNLYIHVYIRIEDFSVSFGVLSCVICTTIYGA